MSASVDDVTTEALPTRGRHPLLVWAWSLLRLKFVGVAFGALFFCLSLTPSLLPRDWLFQGLIGGINAAFGYGLGVLIGKTAYRVVLRNAGWWPPPARVLFWMKASVVAISPTACVLMLVPAASWQRQVSALMGIEGPTTPAYLRTLMVAIAVSALLVAAFRAVIDAIKLLARMLIRRWHIHDEVALFIGTAIVVALLVTLINGVLVRGFFAGANKIFEPQNSETREGLTQPTLPEKSGSPMSLAPWDTLGYQGRNFVATGPHAAELTRINGRPAREPIRVYAGLHTAEDDAGRMKVLVRELERTAASDRKVLVIVPTTGTGWINPVAARAIEMMYNGDTAMVGVQYSYLPSWISFLADRQKSKDSGRALVNTVHDYWQQLPADHRPKLVLYGESLGSMAGQSAFGFLPDIPRMGFDGVLWVGPPHESPLWHALMVRRDPGTPEVLPRYDNGRTVRFSEAVTSDDVARIAAPPWDGTRVLFLQHPSDPVVWWSPDLLFSRPDWLVEPPGQDRTAGDELVSRGDVLASQRRPDRCREHARRPWSQLRRHRARRLGRGGPAGGLAAKRHRTHSDCAETDRKRRRTRTLMRSNGFRAVSLAGALIGWSFVGPRVRMPWRIVAQSGLAGLLVLVTRAPLGLAPPRLWAGLRIGVAAALPAATGVASTTAVPVVRLSMADRELPRPTPLWLLLRIPVGTVWAEEAAYRGALGATARTAFGETRGRLLQAAAFGLSHIADARATSEPVLPTVVATGIAGWVFGWLAERSGSLAAPMLAHLAINEAGAAAALAVQAYGRAS